MYLLNCKLKWYNFIILFFFVLYLDSAHVSSEHLLNIFRFSCWWMKTSAMNVFCRWGSCLSLNSYFTSKHQNKYKTFWKQYLSYIYLSLSAEGKMACKEVSKENVYWRKSNPEKKYPQIRVHFSKTKRTLEKSIS